MTSLLQDAAKGFVLGLSVAAPIGPMGLLCIRRTLERGVWAGITGGLGTAVAHAVYATVAAFGLTAASGGLGGAAIWLQATGIVVLVVLGLRTFTQEAATQKPAGEVRHAGLFAQTFLLTLTNPATVLTFAAMYAGAGLAAGGSTARAAAVVCGTCAGSLAWWVLLSGGVGLLRRRITVRVIVWINRGAGLLLIGFAAILARRLAGAF